MSAFGIPDKDSLRRTATIARVAHALGVPLDSEGRGHCPFHDDSRPSFGLWVDPYGVERWGCFPCGASGDVFDFVMRVRGCNLSDAMRHVVSILRDLPPSRPLVSQKREFDFDACTAYVRDAQARARHADNAGMVCVAAGLVDYNDPVDHRMCDEVLCGFLRWGVDSDFNLVFPHYDETGLLTGCKIRSLDGAKWSFPGSKYGSLYGAWTRQPFGTLILCEGETDMAYALITTGGAVANIAALALPSGAGSFRAEWVAPLERYHEIVIGFDNDDAGNTATEKWMAALPSARTRRYLPPEGQDLRSAKPTAHDITFRSSQS